jgi:hypothetical protein
MSTTSLEFWYQGIPIEKIKRQWIDLVGLLGFTKIADNPEEDAQNYASWDYTQLDKEQAFLGISRRIRDYIAVDIRSHSASITSLETMLKEVYKLDKYPIPAESFLINRDADGAGPLFVYSDSPVDCIKGIGLNVMENNEVYFTPQIRVIHSSLYPNLKELREMSKDYSLGARIIKDALWIDFYWSKYSKTWKFD